MLMLASQGDALNPTISIMIANSLMGIVIVFCVLIFISFIISLFRFLPGSGAAKPKTEPKAAPAPKAEPKAAKVSENLVNDSELVAVITAAIYAYESSTGGAAISGDPLIVRSIRRAR